MNPNQLLGSFVSGSFVFFLFGGREGEGRGGGESGGRGGRDPYRFFGGFDKGFYRRFDKILGLPRLRYDMSRLRAQCSGSAGAF